MGAKIVFLGNTDSQIVQPVSEEGICYSKPQGNENRPIENVITLFVKWGTLVPESL
jgi:hypothetical protein